MEMTIDEAVEILTTIRKAAVNACVMGKFPPIVYALEMAITALNDKKYRSIMRWQEEEAKIAEEYRTHGRSNGGMDTGGDW